jgi:hypothetical protein
VEAESSEADPAATEWEGHNRKERCIKRIVRERHIKDKLGKPAPPAAGGTSAAVGDKAERVYRPGKSPRRWLERLAQRWRTVPSGCVDWQDTKYPGVSVPSANATSSLSRLC